MLNFQSMCIMADLGDETTVAGSNEKVLCVLRAHTDGSFDMTPGFTTPAQRYCFEDDHGGYTVRPKLYRCCGHHFFWRVVILLYSLYLQYSSLQSVVALLEVVG